MTVHEIPHSSVLETVEATAWADFFSAGADTIFRDVSGTTVLRAPAVASADVNRSIGLGSIVPATPDLLDETIACFTGNNPFFLQVVPETAPPELHEWIRARGFSPQRRWVKLFRLPGEETNLSADPSDVVISEVERLSAGTFATTICAGFGFPVEMTNWFSGLIGRPGWRAYLAWLDNEVAGAALLHEQENAASLVAGCALKEYRRRGVQAALIERRIADSAAHGLKLFVTEAAEDIPEKPNPSLHNLLRLGFREAYKRENYLRRQPSENT